MDEPDIERSGQRKSDAGDSVYQASMHTFAVRARTGWELLFRLH
jgi:hypothetical protein